MIKYCISSPNADRGAEVVKNADKFADVHYVWSLKKRIRSGVRALHSRSLARYYSFFSPSSVLQSEQFVGICDGVAHMHAAKPDPLAHRDLKPHNVLLTKESRPIIMDLGSVARWVQGQRMAHQNKSGNFLLLNRHLILDQVDL